MIKRLLLPVGLIVALAVALVFPQPGLWMEGRTLTLAIIATIFLINGYQTELHSLVFGKRLLGAFGIAFLISFVGGSLLGAAAVRVIPFPPGVDVGILVMCTMAPTLSSAIVITRESGGNASWAILLTVGLNLVSIVAIPALLKLLLATTAVTLPVVSMLVDLLLTVLLPFLVGVSLRSGIRRAPSPFIALLPTLLIILLSYRSFCSGRGVLLASSASQLLVLAAVVLGIHLLLLCAAIVLTFVFRYALPERKAIAFLSSQKTLPTAIGILSSLGGVSGPAALPCVMFHFLQIVFDSLLASFWNRPKNRPSKGHPKIP